MRILCFSSKGFCHQESDQLIESLFQAQLGQDGLSSMDLGNQRGGDQISKELDVLHLGKIVKQMVAFDSSLADASEPCISADGGLEQLRCSLN